MRNKTCKILVNQRVELEERLRCFLNAWRRKTGLSFHNSINALDNLVVRLSADPDSKATPHQGHHETHYKQQCIRSEEEQEGKGLGFRV